MELLKEQDLHKNSSQSIVPLSQSCVMADNTDPCEIFTDIDSVLDEKAVETIIQPSTPEDLPRYHNHPSPTVEYTTEVKNGFNTKSINKRRKHNFVKRKMNKKKSRCHGEVVRSTNKTAVGDDTLDIEKLRKYMERRKKNNLASKRSREIRKSKLLEIDTETVKLEKCNKELREHLEQLENLTEKLKEALLKKLATVH